MANWTQTYSTAQQGAQQGLKTAAELKDAAQRRKTEAFGNVTDAVGQLADYAQAARTREDEQKARLDEIGATYEGQGGLIDKENTFREQKEMPHEIALEKIRGTEARKTATAAEIARRETLYGDLAQQYQDFMSGKEMDQMAFAAKLERKRIELEASLREKEQAFQAMIDQAAQGQADEAAMERLREQIAAERLAVRELQQWKEDVEFKHEGAMADKQIAANQALVQLRADIEAEAQKSDDEFDESEAYLKLMKMAAIASGRFELGPPDGMVPDFDYSDADAVAALRTLFEAHAKGLGESKYLRMMELFDLQVQSRLSEAASGGSTSAGSSNQSAVEQNISDLNKGRTGEEAKITDAEKDLYLRLMNASADPAYSDRGSEVMGALQLIREAGTLGSAQMQDAERILSGEQGPTYPPGIVSEEQWAFDALNKLIGTGALGIEETQKARKWVKDLERSGPRAVSVSLRGPNEGRPWHELAEIEAWVNQMLPYLTEQNSGPGAM